jgi:DNA-binding NarL/FixJ family response regulator
MINSILIIDDEKLQAENIQKAFRKEKPQYEIFTAFEEEDILDKIENLFFSVAIVDLRMDKFNIDGFEIIKRIIRINPFAKIIIVTAFSSEYINELNTITSTGKIKAVVDKKVFKDFIQEIFSYTDEIVADFENNDDAKSKALLQVYAEAKNEVNTYKKGMKFENFTALLFAQMGFNHIKRRNKDKSSNEVDLIVRNDIEDSFFQKFNPYFLIECKNMKAGVSKNDFIVFKTKLNNTNGLANLGFFITTSYMKRTAYLEAIRSSKGNNKVIFISNPEIEKIIKSSDTIQTLKLIIDDQVKDN